MSILCAIFGHRDREDDYSGGEYMNVIIGAIDGIGRKHATLYATCPRCGNSYRAGMIHLPARHKERQLDKQLAAHGVKGKTNG